MVFRFGITNLIPHFFKPFSDAVSLHACSIKVHGDSFGVITDADRKHSRKSVKLPLDCFYIVLIAYVRIGVTSSHFSLSGPSMLTSR